LWLPVARRSEGRRVGALLHIGFEAFGEDLEERVARLTSNKKETPPGV
jgi:hypothetical protein